MRKTSVCTLSTLYTQFLLIECGIQIDIRPIISIHVVIINMVHIAHKA